MTRDKLFKKIKEAKKLVVELYKEGVIDVAAYNDDGVHITLEKFIELFSDSEIDILDRREIYMEDFDNPYELIAKVEGLRVFTIASKTEYARIKSKLKKATEVAK